MNKSLIFLAILMLTACGGGNNKNNSSIDIESTEQQDKNSSSEQEQVLEQEELEEEKKLAYIASSPKSYSELNLIKNSIKPWEDGMRTSGESGSYEWWYSDFIFEDGTTVAVAFYSKLLFDTYGAALPLVTLNIVYPDGRKVDDRDMVFRNTIDASKSIADVHINNSYLTYKDGNYKLHYSNGEITFDATMISRLPMWRPETGHIYFGGTKNYFAWLAAQPASAVTATLKENGKETKLKGIGYHDHNWGNSPMHENIDNWYWGRATIGEYNLIFSDIIAKEKYNNDRIPILMLAKGNQILDLNGSIEIRREDLTIDTITNKLYANKLYFEQKDTKGKTYTIESIRKKDMAFVDMNILPYESGDNPTYLRSLSDIILTVTDKNGTKEEFKGLGIMEQMSFYDDVVNTPKSK